MCDSHTRVSNYLLYCIIHADTVYMFLCKHTQYCTVSTLEFNQYDQTSRKYNQLRVYTVCNYSSTLSWGFSDFTSEPDSTEFWKGCCLSSVHNSLIFREYKNIANQECVSNGMLVLGWVCIHFVSAHKYIKKVLHIQCRTTCTHKKHKLFSLHILSSL